MFSTRIVVLCACLACATLAEAQTTYRWIDKATGKTVFSDQPPPPGVKVIETKEGKASADDRQLPFATRQAMEKYPVTLITAANCTEVCAEARSLLNGRGIPFSEKLLTTQNEVDEMAKQMGSTSFLPALKVGQQKFAGYEAGAWNNLLDLAGYPKSAPYGSKPGTPLAQ